MSDGRKNRGCSWTWDTGIYHSASDVSNRHSVAHTFHNGGLCDMEIGILKEKTL